MSITSRILKATEVRILLVTGMMLAALFITFPQIDLWVSGLFYQANAGGFTLREAMLPETVHRMVPVITVVTFALLVLAYIVKSQRPNAFPLLTRRALLFLILALLIGPGLVVNSIFKENWGRARPVNIEQFGGEKTFTPAWIVSDQGGKSFSSGDAAVGFFFAAFAYLYSGRKCRQVFLAGVGFGLLLGLVRIVMGGHFLSDVLFSGIFVLLTN
ncbi:MAG: phosphatase PAP2 family protein, partial [Rickettsiales bacterium]|nr:phosphatase PAP2 family protein [Rickettsiales bacterium]